MKYLFYIFFALTFLPPLARAEKLPPAEILAQLGHTSEVTSLSFTPNGRFALSASHDGTVVKWDLATGRQLKRISTALALTGADFWKEGQFAFIGSYDGTAKLIDLYSGFQAKEFKAYRNPAIGDLPSQVLATSISPDQNLALTVSGLQLGGVNMVGVIIQQWDIDSGREVRQKLHLKDPSAFLNIGVVPGNLLAIAAIGRRLISIDLTSGTVLWEADAHPLGVTKMALSPIGDTAASVGPDKTLKLWDVSTGNNILERRVGILPAMALSFSPDGKKLAYGGDDKILKVLDISSNKLIHTLRGHEQPISAIKFSPDGRLLMSGGQHGETKFWDLQAAQETLASPSGSGDVTFAAFMKQDDILVTISEDNVIRFWETKSGILKRALKSPCDRISRASIEKNGDEVLLACVSDNATVAVSVSYAGDILDKLSLDPKRIASDGRTILNLESFDMLQRSRDGKLLFSRMFNKTFEVRDSRSGRLVRRLPEIGEAQKPCTVTADDTRLVCGSSAYTQSADGRVVYDGTIKVFDVGSGTLTRIFRGHAGNTSVSVVGIAGDSRTVASGTISGNILLWNLETGRTLAEWKSDEQPNFISFSNDGTRILTTTGGYPSRAQVWDLRGRLVFQTVSKTKRIRSASFSRDQKLALGYNDGTVELWSVEKEKELVRLAGAGLVDYIAMTSSGFFTATQAGSNILHIVQGEKVLTIGELRQSLYNPDLVREALAGDPGKEVASAATLINLDKVIDSAPAPRVDIVSNFPGNKSASDLVMVTASIADRGKGIGRIEWRVNGLTVGVSSAPAGSGTIYKVVRQLALEPGENKIEVVAYNAENLISSRPSELTLIYEGPIDVVKPKLHVLAIGIDTYEDGGSTSGKFGYFPPLSLAVADAKAFGEEMKKAGAALYSDVIVNYALDADATPERLEHIVDQMATEVSPRDTFVLFAAGHGYSKDGHFYLIPQNYQGGAEPDALKSRAISQNILQDWIANRLKSKKSVILLDTCQSGAVIGGYARPRTEVGASEAGIGRLHEATGRPVLTAAAAQQFAREGYKNHGVFTYALIEALHNGDTNNNGKIEITELASYVQNRVPEIVAELDKNGGVVKGVAVIAMRGAAKDEQSARFGSIGEDFALVQRLP